MTVGEQRINAGGFEPFTIDSTIENAEESRLVQDAETREVRTLIAAIDAGILPEDLAGAATAHVAAWVEAVVG